MKENLKNIENLANKEIPALYSQAYQTAARLWYS